jgi:hypothetical protein
MPVCLTAALLLAMAAGDPATPVAGPTAPTVAGPGSFDHVILISVDGLRPDAIDGPEDGELPGFTRLLRGPHTLQARSDADITVTLPNHMSMITSRPVGGSQGHGWIENEDPPASKHGGTLHKRKGAYVASVYDVAHDHGVETAMIASKTKFSITVQTYENDEGAPDTVGPDNGRNKVDEYAVVHTMRKIREMSCALLALHPKRSFQVLHFGAPDFAGHAKGWDLSPGSQYRDAVREVDGEIAGILSAIDADPVLKGKVAIVLTADHGGGVPFISHTDRMAPQDFLIPFIVWLGSDGPSTELAALNADRRAVVPADQYVDNSMSPQPIRNAEAGNLALQLLGLPAIPGSVANAKQDLKLLATPATGAVR